MIAPLQVWKNTQSNRSGGLTRHAEARMRSRRISGSLVDLTIAYGRVSHIRGAVIYAIGNKEVARAQKVGDDIRECQGIHVVTSTKSGAIITVYRNRDLRKLKPRSRYETFNQYHQKTLASEYNRMHEGQLSKDAFV